ncbi:Acyl- sterol acyl transferase [Chlorella sorokiniana]|uniref:Acyl-sterol acyl transferase n=1 Tax=Chlorella sorokiniana TaxID=3076 RepID=A0A2P6TLG5_CHLSO|nr:Acyl- sterol acyl transferase [Chlorella sorokiniana]|eukprot:PRW45129.1 Acyl- sterol acyl transferase [Chlorella sorokiniana]
MEPGDFHSKQTPLDARAGASDKLPTGALHAAPAREDVHELQPEGEGPDVMMEPLRQHDPEERLPWRGSLPAPRHLPPRSPALPMRGLLALLLAALLLLGAASSAAGDRGDAFPGYKEEAPACSDQLGAAICEDYKATQGCSREYVKKASLDELYALSWSSRILVYLAWASLIGPLLLAAQRRRGPGLPRLLAAAPIIAINFAIPLIFWRREEVLSSFSAAIATAMITNMKVLGWVMNRGSLLHPLNLPQFLMVASMPFIPAQVPPEKPAESSSNGRGSSAAPAGAEGEEAEEPEDTQAKRRPKGRVHETESVPHMLLRFARKIVGLAAVVYALTSLTLPPIPHLMVQTYSMYMILSIFCDAAGAAVSHVLNLPISPHFTNPYGATSIADFWNRRWNQIVSYLLRTCVYDPLMEGRPVHRPGAPVPAFSRTRRMLGVLASFGVSALLHEMLFWYPARRFTPHLLWTWHFVLWGVIIIAENVSRKAMRRAGIILPDWLAIILVQTTLHVMLALFWFPPLNTRGIPLPGWTIMDLGAHNIAETWREVGAALLGSAAKVGVA